MHICRVLIDSARKPLRVSRDNKYYRRIYKCGGSIQLNRTTDYEIRLLLCLGQPGESYCLQKNLEEKWLFRSLMEVMEMFVGWREVEYVGKK